MGGGVCFQGAGRADRIWTMRLANTVRVEASRAGAPFRGDNFEGLKRLGPSLSSTSGRRATSPCEECCVWRVSAQASLTAGAMACRDRLSSDKPGGKRRKHSHKEGKDAGRMKKHHKKSKSKKSHKER